MKKQEESKVGKKLSDLTTKWVIVLVLTMMFSVPIFMLTTYREENTSFEFGLKLMNQYNENSTTFETVYDDYIDQHKEIRTNLIYLVAFNSKWENEDVNRDKIRSTEFTLVTGNDDNTIYGLFYTKKNTMLEAALSLAWTVFICFVLAGGALMFSWDTDVLVIYPIENMIWKVKDIAANPLNAAKEEAREA